MTQARPEHHSVRSWKPSTLTRTWNRLSSFLHSGSTPFVYSPLYRVDLGATPLDVQRAERILTFLLAGGLLSPKSLRRPEVASLWDLRLAHGRRYLEELRRPESLEEIVGTAVWPDLHRQALLAQRAAVGGTLLATLEALANRSIVVNLGGGFHHAGRLQGRGFCIFNDVAVAVGRARREGFSGPVLVVDLDLHDGNGTREIFAQDESVFTFSIHNQGWDDAPATASLSIELEGEVDDQTYLAAIREHLPRLIDQVEPGIVFFLAGTDPAIDDRIGNWRISAAGMLERDRYVIAETQHRRGPLPLVMLLAGGYGNEAWRYSARTFGWLLTGRRRIEPPTTTAITLARLRHLTRELRYHDRDQHEQDDNWGLTEADILGGFGTEARRSLFLGHYSHHAVELTLEWTGILDRLRQMGIAHPILELDLDNPSGHTARLFTDSQRRETLMELRLRLDRRSIPGMALLSLEWLLLQNPRATFTNAHPPLPGQQHPGLGLVPDIMSLLILMCDQLQLDGIRFVPSQYHLAVKARRFLSFLEARDESWFRAVQDAVANLPLAQATRLVAEGELVDHNTGEAVEWRPMPMVLPISDHLHELVEGDDYQHLAAKSAGVFKVSSGL